MNIKTPLAAALLFTASSAMAQLVFTPPPTFGSGASPEPGSASLLSPYSTVLPDDASFNCSTYYNLHIPYAMCTPEQERSRLSFLGMCPLSNKACRDYMDRIMLPKNSNEAELIGAKDSGPGVPCQVPPCLTQASAPAPEAIAAGASAQSSGSGEIYGPPLPPGFYDKQDKKTLVEARKEIGSNGVKDVIDLGNGNIAKMRDDGTVQMCAGRSSTCAEPVPADTVKNPKIESWVANNNAGFVGEGGGFKAASTPGGDKGAPGAPGGTRKGAPGGANPETPPSDAGSEGDSGVAAYNMGRSLGDETGALSGPGGPSSSGVSSGFGGYGAQGAAGKVEKVDTAEFKRLLGSPDSYTYPVLGAMSEKAAHEINPDVFDAEAKAKQDAKVELKFRGTQTEAQ